ncbi:Glyceraldehyde 3-phosphate phosphatase [Candidatus Tiddalikarchaeum anstoanum]|nr:Glyceraldehyde 3-phosphate phosphatase [Candidatus Tiddalikarchaeum anstoanum]
MIRAVLFDIDNTLTDYVKIKTACVNAAIKAMIKAGLEMDSEDAYDILMKIYRKSFYESKTIFQAFLKHVNGVVDYKILGAAIVAYRQIRYFVVKPYNGVVKTLKALKKKGIKLGVLTDTPKVKAWVRLTNLGIVDYFDCVITFEDTRHRKPNLIPFKKVVNTLHIKPCEILFVGDNPNRDIKGGKKIGMKTALAKYGQFIKGKEKADYELNKISDVLKYI